MYVATKSDSTFAIDVCTCAVVVLDIYPDTTGALDVEFVKFALASKNACEAVIGAVRVKVKVPALFLTTDVIPLLFRIFPPKSINAQACNVKPGAIDPPTELLDAGMINPRRPKYWHCSQYHRWPVLPLLVSSYPIPKNLPA